MSKKHTMNKVWFRAIHETLAHGNLISPRHLVTMEILQRTLAVDMRWPVLTIPERKLSYQFMAAEAYWIITGDNRVKTIAPYNKNISQFSDDGEVFFGAYGPKVVDQLGYVISKLISDPDSRQAGLTIWRENPPTSKDIPCTIAIFFSIRNSKLNCHTFMRSSDLWLGVPYDIFTFSMLGHIVCGFLNHGPDVISPGMLYLTAASSHLYERDFDKVADCVDTEFSHSAPTPESLFISSNGVTEYLQELRDSKPGDPLRWWENS